MRYDDWIDDDEYPDDEDIEAFGYDSPPDNDPLTIGYVDDSRPAFWTTRRIVLLIVILIIFGALLFPSLLRLF
ncbi:MAG: hypothetical protein Q9P44_19030 [Anaerolineae bacterium]|nr:hypothetical protein [Anaerolineae bacterium]